MTGLDSHDTAGLTERDLRSLARWHKSVAGNDDGRDWFPGAVRRLDVGTRLALANDPEHMAVWTELERRRCQADPIYLTESYGHVQPERAGASPIPFALWEMVEEAAERCVGARCQREVLEAFVRDQIVVVLKARQLGLTWLALHFSLWLMGFEPDLPRAKVLALSKTETDAQKLLARLRKINLLLPPFLRHAEDPISRGSLSRYKMLGRGEAVSLTSTEHAARSEQADLLLWDEAAFTRNQQFEDIWTAAEPTLGPLGKAFIVSTGNGGPQAPSDGQGFASLYTNASQGKAPGVHAIFLPDDVHPDRGHDFRVRARARFEAAARPEKFEQEHPFNEDEALAGEQGPKVYSGAGISAAVKLGTLYDEALAAGTLPMPTGGSDGMLAGGFDHGTLTGMLTVWELEAGGIYVPPGAFLSEFEETGEKTLRWHDRVRVHVQEPYSQGGPLRPLIGWARYDAAGVEQHATFRATTEKRTDLMAQWNPARTQTRRRIRGLGVKFGSEATGKGSRGTYKYMTIGYLQWLFNRTARGERYGIIVISPQNEDLIRQLRGLEWEEDGTGRVKKVDDHLPDALIAGGAPIAWANRGRAMIPEDEVEEAA